MQKSDRAIQSKGHYLVQSRSKLIGLVITEFGSLTLESDSVDFKGMTHGGKTNSTGELRGR